MNNTKRSGYILALSLMIISLMTLLATQIFNKTLLFVPFSRVVVDREKAKVLAQGGVQIALAQLNAAVEIEKDKKPDATQQAKQLLLNILPALNRWQTFKLKKNIDGINATLRVCISCEDGKIDLNSLYDTEKKEFKNEKTATYLFEQIEKSGEGKGLRDAFEKFLKDRQNKIDDVTQLLELKPFEGFKERVFYAPITEKKEKRGLYLTDIFTVWSERPMMEPWLLSDSIAGVLKLQRAQFGDTKKRTDAVEKWLTDFKLQHDWQKDWDATLAPLYDAQSQKVPQEIFGLFSQEFEPRTFSVLCSSTVGSITQKLLAIIRRYTSSSDDEPRIKIIKQYWL